jgi:molybdenum cofactor cytidylyltransferase
MSDTDPERIAGVVLAAGKSARMGRNKLLLQLDGVSLVRRAVQNAVNAGLAPVVVVLGFEEERVRKELRGLERTIVTNPDFDGPSSKSLHVGLRALPEEVDGAVVILPDMVHVSSDALRAVKTAAGASSAPLIVSRYGDVTAPPILFRRVLFDELLAWEGEGCGKPVVKAHAREATYVSWPPEMLDDVDTPEDFARVAG